MGMVTLLGRLLGYGEKLVLAYKLGTSYEVDVYNVVTGVIMTVFLFFREVVEPGFLNSFLRALGAGDRQGAWAVFNRVFIYILIIAGVLSVIVLLWPSACIHLFAPGFTGEKRALGMSVLKWAFPACIFLSLSVLTNISLNGFKYFAGPALGELLYKLVVLVALLVLYNRLGIYAVVVGVLAGGLSKLVFQGMLLSKFYIFSKAAVSPELMKTIWRFSWPLLIGVAFSQLSSLVDVMFTSYLREGAIAALSYAKKIVELPVMLFPYILSVTIFPRFSELAIGGRRRELNALFMKQLKWIILVFVPLAVLFATFSYQLTALVLKRGAFDAHSTLLTARPLFWYALGMPFFAVETVLVIFYFSIGEVKKPILIGVLCVVENILFTALLIRHYDYQGVAIAYSIAKATKVMVLLLMLRRRMEWDRPGWRPAIQRALSRRIRYK